MILALLQNQWSSKPAELQRVMDRHPVGPRRRQIIKRLLFYGCTTGKRLQDAFGTMLDRIEFENTSPRVGGSSSSYFGSDKAHLLAVVRECQPDLILAFGAVAQRGLEDIGWISHSGPWAGRAILGPHPAARGSVLPELQRMARELVEHDEFMRVTGGTPTMGSYGPIPHSEF